MNENQSNFHWCWDRLQFMSVAACESRVKKGTCKMLPKPKLLEPWKVATWKHSLGKDVSGEMMECEEKPNRILRKPPEQEQANGKHNLQE